MSARQAYGTWACLRAALSQASCGNADLAVPRALYALAIAHSRLLDDGNTGTTFAALETFLVLNRLALAASDAGGAPS